MDPQYIEVSDLFTKHGVYIAYKNREPGATAPKTFLVRLSREQAECGLRSSRTQLPKHACLHAC